MEADMAKAALALPEGDHLSLVNVYNQFLLSEAGSSSPLTLSLNYFLRQT